MYKRTKFISASVLLYECNAFAEVMDKMPSLGDIWAWAFFGSILGALLYAYKWWIGGTVYVITIISVASTTSLFLSPTMLAAIRAEVGVSYEQQCYLATAVVLSVAILSIALKILKNRRRPKRRFRHGDGLSD